MELVYFFNWSRNLNALSIKYQSYPIKKNTHIQTKSMHLSLVIRALVMTLYGAQQNSCNRQ